MKWPLVTRVAHEKAVAIHELELKVTEHELEVAETRIRELHDELSLCRRQKRELVSALARAAREIAALTEEPVAGRTP